MAAHCWLHITNDTNAGGHVGRFSCSGMAFTSQDGFSERGETVRRRRADADAILYDTHVRCIYLALDGGCLHISYERGGCVAEHSWADRSIPEYSNDSY